MLPNGYRLVLLCVFAFGCLAPATPVAAQFPGFSSGSKDAPAESKESADKGDSLLLESPFFKVGWPKIQMPKFDWKPGFGGEKTPANAGGGGENPVSRTLDKVADGSKRAASRVREAWGSAVNQLSFASPSAKPSEGGGFWSRWFKNDEPREPLTTTEFLAQDRVGTRK